MDGTTFSAFTEMAKGFGASGPVILVLLYFLHDERKERRALQKENVDLLRESMALGGAMKSLLERIVSKVGA